MSGIQNTNIVVDPEVVSSLQTISIMIEYEERNSKEKEKSRIEIIPRTHISVE